MVQVLPIYAILVLIAQHIQDVRRGPGSLCLWPYSLEEIYGKWPFENIVNREGLCVPTSGVFAAALAIDSAGESHRPHRSPVFPGEDDVYKISSRRPEMH
jgi:hypothetical protein